MQRPPRDRQHYEQEAGLAGWNLDLTADLAGRNVPRLIDSTRNKKQALQVRI